MPDVTGYTHGQPSWTDLSTTDVDAAKSFYTALFGWSYEDNEMGEGMVYSMAQLDGKPAGAIFAQQAEQAQQGIPPMWNTYVTVDDADATAVKVTEAGGQVIAGPFDVFDSGRMTLAMDPTGAVIAFWQAKQHIGAHVVAEPGAITWFELMTRDTAAAAQFYADVLGWHAHEADEGYTMFHVSEDELAGGMMQMDESMAEVPPHWMVYFAVSDCDGTVAKAKELGGSAIVEPTDIPPGRFAVVQDPQGAAFAVIQVREQA